jgi:hypothetical protein
VALYFFHTRDNDTYLQDDVGLEFETLAEARDQSAISLAEMARDVLPGSIRRVLSVEVAEGPDPVLIATLAFEAIKPGAKPTVTINII